MEARGIRCTSLYGSTVQYCCFAVLFAFSQVALGEKCAYRDGIPDGWTFSQYDEDGLVNVKPGPGKVRVKECAWGCCWHVQGICCPMPTSLNIVVVVVIVVCLVVGATATCTCILLMSRWWLRRKQRQRQPHQQNLPRPPAGVIASNGIPTVSVWDGPSSGADACLHVPAPPSYVQSPPKYEEIDSHGKQNEYYI